MPDIDEEAIFDRLPFACPVWQFETTLPSALFGHVGTPRAGPGHPRVPPPRILRRRSHFSRCAERHLSRAHEVNNGAPRFQALERVLAPYLHG